MKLKLVLKGGPGSGHRGHTGRLGKVGGSAPGTSIHPGGLYSEVSWDAVPDRVFHGTASGNIDSILANGISASPRSPGAVPLVSTTPHLDTAIGWGSDVVLELNISDIKGQGKAYAATLFDEIAFERSIPSSAIRRIWRPDWHEPGRLPESAVVIRGSMADEWVYAATPEVVT